MELTETVGIRLSVHDQETMPFPEDDGMLIAPNKHTILNLQKVKPFCLEIEIRTEVENNAWWWYMVETITSRFIDDFETMSSDTGVNVLYMKVIAVK